MTWQPISTAPRDGTKIIVWTVQDGFMPWVYWDSTIRSSFDSEKQGKPWGWMSEVMRWSGKPTHWMHFPEPPKP